MNDRKFQIGILIDDRTEVAFRLAGDGNKSAGARRIADEWLTRYHAEETPEPVYQEPFPAPKGYGERQCVKQELDDLD